MADLREQLEIILVNHADVLKAHDNELHNLHKKINDLEKTIGSHQNEIDSLGNIMCDFEEEYDFRIRNGFK